MTTPRRFASRLAVCALLFATPGLCQVFPGTGGGAIPDNDPNGVAIDFAATGVVGEVRDVRVILDISHTWLGDVTATLSSPGGVARLKLFGRIGSSRASGFGDSSNLTGVYEFSDAAPQDLWVAASLLGDAGVVAPGTYRTTTAGRGNVTTGQRSNAGGCSTFLQLAFRGLTGARANGTWSLRVTDGFAGDLGSVVAATSSLTLVTGPAAAEPAMFRSGFEDAEVQDPPLPPAPVVASTIRGACTPGVNSVTGSGLTDFVLVRSIGAGRIQWVTRSNENTAAGVDLAPFEFGRDTDFFLLGDFDGDGLSDPTLWSSGPVARFQVRRSSRPTDAPLVVEVGSAGDVPDVIADFDGDRVTDFAVYRDGTAADTTARFLVRRSSTAASSDFPITDSDGAIPFALRDVDGDGRADYGIQFNSGGGVGGFRIFNGATAAPIGSPFNFGQASDFVIPGHSVGSAVTDIAVSRNANPGTGTLKYAFPRDMETGAGDASNLATGIVFGIPGDFITQGDYDGDGVTDYAGWRSSATPGASKFVIRRSTDTAVPLEVPFGQSGDYPVNNWDVH